MRETPAFSSVWRQYWIFQANPERYDARAELRDGHTVNWTVSRFVNQYRVGDTVFLWIAGKEAGIYGWGVVVGEVYLDGDSRRLPVEYRCVLESPITPQMLKETGNRFAGLTILRNPTGANFRVTVLEVIALNELIKAKGVEPPEDPEEGSGPNGEVLTRAVYLFDYRFDAEVKSVIAIILNSARFVNGIVFPKLLFDAPLVFLYKRLNEDSGDKIYSNLADILHLNMLWERLKLGSPGGLIIGNSSEKLTLQLSEDLLVKRTAFTVLALARRIAISTTGKEQIAFRHLLGAVLQGATEAFQKYMQEMLSAAELNLADTQQSYLNYVSKSWPEDNQNAWKYLFVEEVATTSSEQSEDDFTPLLTKLDSDTADEANNDLLNIDEDAVSFAKILCAKDAAPPLAIGLFGDWGSGKTFFMRRMRQHVNTLTESISSTGATDSPAYHGKIAQIWFNAWHYQEGNLWASMVNRVFSGLKQELRRLNEGDAEAQFKELMECLDEDREREQELQLSAERIQTLTKKNSKLEADIAALKAQKNNAGMQPEMKLNSLNALEKYSGELESIFEIKGLSGQINSIVAGSKSVNEFLQTNIKDGAWNNLKRWLRFFMMFKLQLFAVVAVSGITGLLYWHFMPDPMDMKSMGFLSTFSLVVGAIYARFNRLGKIFRLFKSLKKDFESAEEIENKKILQLSIEQRETQTVLKQVQQNYDRLNAEYGRDSDEAFASFIFSRAASEDYKSQLGILNTIRRDFSRLDELLRSQNNSKLPRLNRIVLYIDDLDRCEPEVVVDVLQAIHLMLAYPIFMVVVGVDARWLGRSLKKRYPFLVHEQAVNVSKEASYAASTHDYLEKIFQIPFWLKPLDGERATQMMKGLLAPGLIENENVKTPEQPELVESKELPVSDEDNTELFVETEDNEEGYEDQALNEKAEITSEDVIVTNLVSTRALEMTKDELAYFEKLGAIVGRSPRAVKRFVNLYRILKAAQPRTRVAGFSEANGDFRAPLFLLAVLCGFPKEASAFFTFLKNASEDGLQLSSVVKARDDATNNNWLNLQALIINTVPEMGDIPVSLLNSWVESVARFSYREWVN